MKKLKIVMLGSGNVATHLSKALNNKGHNIMQVYSYTLANALSLADELGAEACSEVSEINSTADLYIMSLSDSVMEQVLSQLASVPKMIVHTAGSIPMSVFSDFPSYGVFYPLQTFSKARDVNIQNVPFCIEASDAIVNDVLFNLANQLSDKVLALDSEQRKQCHLAAVFANNFVNHFYTLSSSLLAEKDIPLNILHPLIEETAQKIKDLDPAKAQTGPAARKDKNVMDEHKRILSAYGLSEMYSFVSESILKYHDQ